jgi:hypothetical protein
MSQVVRNIVTVPDDLPLPSMRLIAAQVEFERETMNSHAESLDTKAGVVLGFAGVLVGLGATAQGFISNRLLFQAGLVAGVTAGVLAAWAFLPRRYPVIEVLRLRERYLTAPEEVTQPHLLDTQIEMVRQAADLVRRKGRRVKASVVCLAGAAAAVVAGTLMATGGKARA